MEKKTMGSFLAALRRANGMTQKELAERLNVSDKSVSRWERDDGAPDLALIPVIAEVFGVTCDELLRGVYECIKSGLTEGEPVARVDADHFAFHLVERQRSAVLERLRQIERRIRRLSDKMGVIHLVPRFGIYAMRPEEDARRSCELANLALEKVRSLIF